MSNFLEERLPVDVRLGASWADDYEVMITQSASGAEFRKLVHPFPVRSFHVNFTTDQADLWARVLALYHRAYLIGACSMTITSGDPVMQEAQIERRKMVTLPQEEFETMLERAAERGARHALSEVGLDGPDAARDLSELRSLLDAFNEAKKTAGLTIVRMLVTGLVMATLAGAFVKLKVFGGGQ